MKGSDDCKSNSGRWAHRGNLGGKAIHLVIMYRTLHLICVDFCIFTLPLKGFKHLSPQKICLSTISDGKFSFSVGPSSSRLAVPCIWGQVLKQVCYVSDITEQRCMWLVLMCIFIHLTQVAACHLLAGSWQANPLYNERKYSYDTSSACPSPSRLPFRC